MRYQISKGTLPMATIELGPNEKIFSDSGTLVYMTGNTIMQAKARGGVMKSLGRMFTGENVFLTEFMTTGGQGLVAVAGPVPGSIIAWELAPGRALFGQKGAFLAADDAINMEVAFQRKIGAGFLGGEGFIIQKYTGQGTILLHAAGEFIEMDLQPGQNVRVDTQCCVAWEDSVKYDIAKAGGIKVMALGGEGLFLNSLTGPGKVIIQSMDISQLAHELAPYLPSRG
ncbi:MAG: TIGR00266 family protein [Thermoplasmata archaeon]|nr:TIGR00266 family protein [Thermoplasmata archaeon]